MKHRRHVALTAPLSPAVTGITFTHSPPGSPTHTNQQKAPYYTGSTQILCFTVDTGAEIKPNQPNLIFLTDPATCQSNSDRWQGGCCGESDGSGAPLPSEENQREFGRSGSEGLAPVDQRVGARVLGLCSDVSLSSLSIPDNSSHLDLIRTTAGGTETRQPITAQRQACQSQLAASALGCHDKRTHDSSFLLA